MGFGPVDLTGLKELAVQLFPYVTALMGAIGALIVISEVFLALLHPRTTIWRIRKFLVGTKIRFGKGFLRRPG